MVEQKNTLVPEDVVLRQGREGTAMARMVLRSDAYNLRNEDITDTSIWP